MENDNQATSETTGEDYKIFYSNDGDELFKIKMEQYKDFIQNAKKSLYYDEEQIDEFTCLISEAVKDLKSHISKKKQLAIIIDLIDVISIEQLSELKPFELEPLLKAKKENYLVLFEEIQSGIAGLDLPVTED